jgi:hypothetical protein
MWFYIQNSNESRNAQTLLVIGDVEPSYKSISLHITRSPDKFKLSVNHYPTNIILNDYLFEKNTWYNIVYVKNLLDYSFYVDGVFVSTIRDIRQINLPDNSPISIGRDHSRPSFSPLFSTRVGIVSIYQRYLNISEISALYNDYKINFQNIPLISDALMTTDLTKSETVLENEIIDLSGNGNNMMPTHQSNLYYDGETSIIFNGIGRRLIRRTNMLEGNVSLSFNIWILVNKQTGSVPPRDQRILTIGNKFHLT